MATEDEIIKRADRILQDTGKHRPVPRMTAQDASEILDSKLHDIETRARLTTAPYAKEPLEAITMKVHAARRVLVNAFDVFQSSGIPIPEWMTRVMSYLDSAVEDLKEALRYP